MDIDALRPSTDAAYPAQAVSYTGTAGTSSTWPRGPKNVLVWTTTDAYVAVGESVTATTSVGCPIPAYTPVVFQIPQGTNTPWTVSAIQVSAGGTVYAKPLV